ncbi:hypothetical protein BXZ70DRAFT_905667 [Cristinia sonorae]|uniref:Uncharacterized protein n=1 Tax=Cristinia sonorae TaxID=1940300 RepID=A0A8K0XRW8_9AGAR|nr:hypothetical protein BXZ70DRAFT_905667 [Cristinia sonorae]
MAVNRPGWQVKHKETSRDAIDVVSQREPQAQAETLSSRTLQQQTLAHFKARAREIVVLECLPTQSDSNRTSNTANSEGTPSATWMRLNCLPTHLLDIIKARDLHDMLVSYRTSYLQTKSERSSEELTTVWMTRNTCRTLYPKYCQVIERGGRQNWKEDSGNTVVALGYLKFKRSTPVTVLIRAAFDVNTPQPAVLILREHDQCSPR